MSIRKFYHLLNLIREVDLEAIRREASHRFDILVTGRSDPDVLSLARLLSGEPEIHPWVDIQMLPFKAGNGWSLALLVVHGDELHPDEEEARARLREMKVPVVVVVLGAPFAREALPRRGEAARVHLPSASDRVAFEEVLAPKLLEVVPHLQLALGRQLQGLRPIVADRLVEETARANAMYVLTTGLAGTVPLLSAPLAVADVVVLTKNQLLMAYKLALVAGKEGHPRDVMGEVVGVIGTGLLFRQIARELVGLVPGVGIIAKVTVAYAGTWAIGRLVYIWATEGRQLSKEEMQALLREGTRRGTELAARLLRRRREPLPGD